MKSKESSQVKSKISHMIIVLSDDAMLDGKDDLVDEERDRGEDEFELG